MRRAAREQWGVPDEAKTEALFQAAKILTDPNGKPNLKIAAMRFLVAADRADTIAELGQARLELARLKLAEKTSDATDGAGGVEAHRAEKALKALNGECDPDPAPQHPAGDP